MSLPPAIYNLAQFHFDKYFKTLKKVFATDTKLKKMQDSTFIPKSARSNFELGVSSKVKESEKYKTLSNSIEKGKETFQKLLKQQIVSAVELEKEEAMLELKSLFCEAVHKVTKIFCLWKTTDDDIEDLIVYNEMKNVFYNNSTLLEFVFPNNYNEFNRFYRKQFTINSETDNASMYNVTEINDNDEDNVGADASMAFAASLGYSNDVLAPVERRFTTPRTNITSNTAHKYVLDTHTRTVLLHGTFLSMFINPWKNFLIENNKKMNLAKLTKYATSQMVSKATDEAAAIVNAKPSVEPSTVKDIISKAVSESTKTLHKKIASLEQQLQRSTISTKNSQRSKTPTRASQKTKSKNSTPTKSTKTQQTRAGKKFTTTPLKLKVPAAGAVHDLQRNKKKSTKKHAPKSPQKKKEGITRSKKATRK